MAGRRKQRNIKIRGARLSKLDQTKLEVAVWLMAKNAVEDRTKRPQPAPMKDDGEGFASEATSHSDSPDPEEVV